MRITSSQHRYVKPYEKIIFCKDGTQNSNFVLYVDANMMSVTRQCLRYRIFLQQKIRTGENVDV